MKKSTTIQVFAAKSLRRVGAEGFGLRLVDMPPGIRWAIVPECQLLLLEQKQSPVQARAAIQAVCKMLTQSPPEAL